MRSAAAGHVHDAALGGAGREAEDPLVRRGEARQVLEAQAAAHGEALLLLGGLGLPGDEHQRAVPAHAGETGGDLVLDAVEHRGHHHQGEDAEHQQGQGEDRAQLVRPELDQAAGDDLPDQCRRTPSAGADARSDRRG